MKRDAQVAGDVKDMKVRKLQPEEHIRTRHLWEEIFTEDTTEFLDYYYSVKIKNNEIYVVEDNGEIVSMLHLNPYEMRVGDKLFQTHYIVAVATKGNYRKQGLMRLLLNHVMQVMADRGEPFTFLMPASEAIYKPFGFDLKKKLLNYLRRTTIPELECAKDSPNSTFREQYKINVNKLSKDKIPPIIPRDNKKDENIK